MMMGTAHCTSRNSPNTVLPRIAPSRAATSVTAIAVDLRCVGNSSTPENVSVGKMFYTRRRNKKKCNASFFKN